jgi:hypothetical protein
MKRHVTFILLCIISLAMGCTSKRGLIALNTGPQGATVYLNQIKQGVTPLEFEYDFRKPATLKIEKNGYYDTVESISELWVFSEIYKGNYLEGKFIIQDKMKKAWKVKITRILYKKE